MDEIIQKHNLIVCIKDFPVVTEIYIFKGTVLERDISDKQVIHPVVGPDDILYPYKIKTRTDVLLCLPLKNLYIREFTNKEYFIPLNSKSAKLLWVGR